MARVTVEDCVEKVPNRFNLVLLAGHRARAIASGAELLVERDNDKNPVVSLREISDGAIEADALLGRHQLGDLGRAKAAVALADDELGRTEATMIGKPE